MLEPRQIAILILQLISLRPVIFYMSTSNDRTFLGNNLLAELI